MPCTKASMLIVDDKSSVRTSLSLALTEIGHSVRSAQDGFSALRELREEIPDILLSDLNMPGMSGFELLRVVRHRFPSIQVIAMSGAFSGSQVPAGMAADGFYQKGSSIGALLQIIEALQFKVRRNPHPPRVPAALLVHRDGKDSFRLASVTIACPECLRTFLEPFDGSHSREHVTDCMHCNSPIRYSVVEPLYRMPPQSFKRRVSARIPAQGASNVGN